MPIEPWREHAVDLNRLFGPYEKWHGFTLRVSAKTRDFVPNPWFDVQGNGYAAILAPPSIPHLPQAIFVTNAAPIARRVEREVNWGDYAWFGLGFGAMAAACVLLICAYRFLLRWAASPQAPRRLQSCLGWCEAVVDRADRELQTLFSEFLPVMQFMWERATVAADVLFCYVVREYRRICALFARARQTMRKSNCRQVVRHVRAVAGLWWSSSRTWLLRMTRPGARRRRLGFALQWASTWCAIVAVALPAAPMQAWADTVVFDSNADGNDGVTEQGGTYTWVPGSTATFFNGSAIDVFTADDLATDVAQFGNGNILSSAATINVGTGSIKGLIFGATTTNGYTLTADMAGRVLTVR